jgi:diguanylate cyclase (GGDEF)-like protein/PAS domain S-box-containing protein
LVRALLLDDTQSRNLLENQETFRLIADTMQDGLVIIDPDLRIIYVNDRLCSMLSYGPEEMIGRPVADFLDEKNQALFAREVARRPQGENSAYELELTARDGSLITTIESPRGIFSGEGRFLGSFAIVTDVTQRRKDEEVLRLTQFLLDHAGEGAFWADADGCFFYVNEAACALMGYSREEMLSLRVRDILPAESADHFRELSRRVREQGPFTFEAIYQRKNGERFPAEITLNYLDYQGRECYCAFARDITERKQVEVALRESEERYHSLFEGVPVGLYRTTPAGRMMDANSALVRILGFASLKSLLATKVADIYVDPEDRRSWQRAMEGAVAAQSFETRVRRADGSVIWVRFTARAFRGEGGEILYYEGALEDVTDRRRAEEALRSSEERFRSLVQNASDLISILDAEGIVRYESPSYQRHLGAGPEEHAGRDIRDLVHLEDRGVADEALATLVAQPSEVVTFEYRLRHRDGSWRVLESTASNLLGQPAVSGIVLNSRDITDRKQAEEKLLHDTLHDELTGLPNRALFMDRLRQSMERSRREPERLTVVLFLDLDRFKLVNDSLGHLVGDELLIQIAGSLAGVLRPADTIARVGGDEFALLLEGGRDVGDAARVADRIHERLAEPINLGGQEVFITASIGIAVHTPEYERPEDLLRDADTAMYRAKASGRACHVVFNRVMHRFVMARLQLETDLRRAVDRGQLRVHYQPVLDLRTGEVMGFEALLRWHHPRRGLLPPDEFLTVAEETGLIVPMGRYLLLESCREIRGLQRKYPERKPLKLSVNLSNKQFFQADLFDQIQEALALSCLEPSCLGLEITEGVIIRHADSAASRFSRLKGMGVQLYLDDFGKGYSSLNYLHRFPMDLLKIDRSFTSRIEEAEGNLAIVKAIVTLAHQLGMEVVAEGIQTAEQRAKLHALGCEYGQGFFISEPVAADGADALLASHARALTYTDS